MQGYILHNFAVKEEDLVVFILTKATLIKAYRFYGRRHSQILNGVKIDFSLEENMLFLPRLKEVIELKAPYNRELMYYWQLLMTLFYKHLKDSFLLESFYYELLDEAYKRIQRQNPKRVIIDLYLSLLSFEGRLNTKLACFLCDLAIEDREIALVRAFLPAHKACIPSFNFDRAKLLLAFESLNSSCFEDDEINALFLLVKEGF